MRTAWGTVSREIALLEPDIFHGLREGRSIRALYLELVASGKTTISQRSFYRFVVPLRDKLSAARSATSIHSKDDWSANQRASRLVAQDNLTDFHDPHTAVSAAVVPLARKSGAGGFTLNRDFNIEE